ncbi:hypothetical protein FOZ63_007866 [Perkinsus olseni]|uniref:Uncharacterized protein n=1 Tax=Perkinsus olseni TaxID=32597 RepID=A0A7J6RUD7_PEROL|nr:hypothetical protein FOZ63_007866 [Perkinsus olseni]
MRMDERVLQQRATNKRAGLPRVQIPPATGLQSENISPEGSANAPERRAHAAQPAIPSSANSQPSLSPSSASSTGMNSDGEEESGISPTTRKSPDAESRTPPLRKRLRKGRRPNYNRLHYGEWSYIDRS